MESDLALKRNPPFKRKSKKKTSVDQYWSRVCGMVFEILGLNRWNVLSSKFLSSKSKCAFEAPSNTIRNNQLQILPLGVFTNPGFKQMHF